MDAPILMVEDLGLATRVRHCKMKLTLFFSAMRHYREARRAECREVLYFEIETAVPLLEALAAKCAELGIDRVVTFAPHDRFFAEELRMEVSLAGLELQEHPSPMFLTPEVEWDRFAKPGQRLVMGDFYLAQRRRLGLLLDSDGRPEGGRWSFDEANRKPLPMGQDPPAIWGEAPDGITREVMAMVEARLADHPGSTKGFAYPVDHAGADRWLDEFLETRLDQFGDYEDALPTAHRTVYHSVLTPMLNCGLLTPGQVVARTLDRHVRRAVPLNSLEGFLRQVVGWREFMFGMDREYGRRGIHEPNFFGHQRGLAGCWWDGTTGLPPLDLSIRRALEHGYCHHIERLMVLGSAMLMCEVDPQEAYRWFMEMFVDSADWVMGPNVLGMSQFADGGLLATKPYLSGSAYLRKMGDYPPGPWCEVWDGLYWRFVARHREFFAKNPRLSVMVGGLDRLDPCRRDRIFAAAEQFIANVTN